MALICIKAVPPNLRAVLSCISQIACHTRTNTISPHRITSLNLPIKPQNKTEYKSIMSGLWNKQPAAQQSPIQRLRTGLVPGTWLQLAPSTSPKYETTEKWLFLSPSTSPLPSPAMPAEKGTTVEELSLSPKKGKFITNAPSNESAATSRAPSMSMARPVPAVPAEAPLELRRLRGADDGERLGRFLSN
ncbi:hypothetical protein AC579_3737 [Pseudocercospora musae]|uniref:Uncharacterized protein n=1 Tax=Pseudocercospora musae TaxID=113226 RepID=A0A139I660_9PEZI|nr:hypothetical protein AC579_3737 [Pseudocercospora musae]